MLTMLPIILITLIIIIVKIIYIIIIKRIKTLSSVPARLNLARRGVSWQIRFVLGARMMLNPMITCLILVLWYNKCETCVTGGLGRWVSDTRPLLSIFRVFVYWAKSRVLIEHGKGCG